ncbi:MULTISPECIES: NAD(P)-binding domain-containing protein [Myxococcus]|uniref:NAD(P)-binding domain-containing protein n=1 Tax=Myxococcus TaxID=32 RepID=UPI001F3050E5|nr:MULTISPECIES: NAD(P)-binding domain-containing protein [Myxococcus]WAM30394.1 NAD(P)-binding domain-containing protein [Myxococcus sp. NMCA1]
MGSALAGAFLRAGHRVTVWNRTASRAGASLALAVGSPSCSSIARTPPASFSYASTRRMPPHLTQAHTSKSNVLLSSSALSTRAVLSFIGSFLPAAWGATLPSSPPAWGNGASAPGRGAVPAAPGRAPSRRSARRAILEVVSTRTRMDHPNGVSPAPHGPPGAATPGGSCPRPGPDSVRYRPGRQTPTG